MRKRVKRKSIVVAFLVLFALLNISMVCTAMAGGTEKNHYIEVKVRSGDTLWELAKDYSQPQQDVRKLIYEIREVNNLTCVDLKPGQTIKIPTE